jgi:mannosyltransferase OCH1-like enzyme
MKIWQTWRTHDPTTFHEYYKVCHPTWKELHPDWDYELVDDNEILDFCKLHFPDIYNTFKNLPKQIYRVDLVRYMILFIKGGLYVDMDFMALKSHTPIWEDAATTAPIVFGLLNNIKRNDAIPNAWMMSVYPNEIFWLLVLEIGIKLSSSNRLHVEACSGPIILTLAYKRYVKFNGNVEKLCPTFLKMFPSLAIRNSKIKLLEPSIIYPCDWTRNSELEMMRSWVNTLTCEDIKQKLPNSYAITFWAHNW